MIEKIQVTKQQLIDLASIELKKEAFYKPYMKIVDVSDFGNTIKFTIFSENLEDSSKIILEGQNLGNRLSGKYSLID